MALSISFALAAALLFSLAMHVQRQALRRLDDVTGTFVTVVTMTVILWLAAGWTIRSEFWRSEATLYFAVSGILFPALAQRLQIASNRHVGPALTAAFGAFLPMFAAVPAVLFLHELLTGRQIVGIALLIGALLFAALARGVSWRSRSFYLLALPVSAALVRALGMPISKAGYNRLAEPFYGIIVMASVSTIVVFLMLLATGGTRRLLPVGAGHRLFALNGVMVGLGILAIQFSLVSGSVSVTTSIIATVPIWTLAMGAFVFRNEQLHWWHGLVAAVVCLGAILIVTGHRAP